MLFCKHTWSLRMAVNVSKIVKFGFLTSIFLCKAQTALVWHKAMLTWAINLKSRDSIWKWSLSWGIGSDLCPACRGCRPRRGSVASPSSWSHKTNIKSSIILFVLKFISSYFLKKLLCVAFSHFDNEKLLGSWSDLNEMKYFIIPWRKMKQPKHHYDVVYQDKTEIQI